MGRFCLSVFAWSALASVVALGGLDPGRSSVSGASLPRESSGSHGDSKTPGNTDLLTIESPPASVPLPERRHDFTALAASKRRDAIYISRVLYSTGPQRRNPKAELLDKRDELCRCHAGARIPRINPEDPLLPTGSKEPQRT
jgi:hypothetical protein